MTERDSLVLNFGDEDEDKCNVGISFEIDKTPCKPNDTVSIYIYGSETDLQYLKLFQEDKDLGLGKLEIQNTTKTENISFNESSYAETKYTINNINSAVATTSILKLQKKSIVSLYAKGSNISTIKKGNSCVGINDNDSLLYGSIDINYEAEKVYKLYTWKAPNVTSTTIYPFFITNKDNEESEYSVTDNFEITVEKNLNQEVDIKFIVKDVANDRLIKDAEVTISQPNNNDFVDKNGTTDDKGEVIFKLMQGETFNIKILATGYIDSDKDYLNNDVFTVPTADEE